MQGQETSSPRAHSSSFPAPKQGSEEKPRLLSKISNYRVTKCHFPDGSRKAGMKLVYRLNYGGKAAYIHGGSGILAGMLAETPRHVSDAPVTHLVIDSDT